MRRWIALLLLCNFLNSALFVRAEAEACQFLPHPFPRACLKDAATDPLDSISEFLIEKLLRIPDNTRGDESGEVELDEIKLGKRQKTRSAKPFESPGALVASFLLFGEASERGLHRLTGYLSPFYLSDYYSHLHRFAVF